jgi:D-alanine-D-alanine ligase
MGGLSAEREVSLCSGRAVSSALRDLGHGVVDVCLNSDEHILDQLNRAEMDVAFLALHGRFGEDGCIQGLLELLGVPYTGSSVLSSALAMDKLKSKELFRLHNVPTPPYYVFDSRAFVEGYTAAQIAEVHGSFGFPALVKPRSEGSSISVSKVEDMSQLGAAVCNALEFDGSALVERFIKGKEVAVGLLNGRVLGAIEIAPKAAFYDFGAKYQSTTTEYFMPARLSGTRYKGVLNLAERAAEALDVTGAARVDLIVTEGQNEYVLEVNTLPGMTESSLLPKIAKAAGYDFHQLCEAILSEARVYASAPAPAAHAAFGGLADGDFETAQPEQAWVTTQRSSQSARTRTA